MLKRSDPDKNLIETFIRKKYYAYTTIFWLSDIYRVSI